ncbi:MAG: FecR domain-containing protein [Verrucomicrobiia bacterium]
MKHIQTLIFMALCGCVLTLAGSATAQSVKPGVATVVRISGEARYSLGDGQWHPLVAGKVLAAGSVIQTGPDATVDIVLGRTVSMPQAGSVPNRISDAADSNVRGLIAYKPSAEQNTIRMTGDTVLAIDKLTVSDTGLDSVSDTELDLRQGGIYNSVKKLSGASQYLIKIPNGIAGVRGTLFYIDATGKCSVFKNSVVLSLIGADGKPATVVVGEGNQFNPQSGQTSPLAPDPLSKLGQTLTAMRTMYYGGAVNFTFDVTANHCSPTNGRNTSGP